MEMTGILFDAGAWLRGRAVLCRVRVRVKDGSAAATLARVTHISPYLPISPHISLGAPRPLPERA